ncbi:hypothetical protein [Dactylosporangium sp. CA-139066]|uniref:hypothetical protein n=1 Tax=Dactylosporangium sp. CA-139066 TaxID=3239930 RepID=UPI003D8FAD63
MANIATVFVRVEPAEDGLTAPDVVAAVVNPDRDSYNVPLWHAERDGFIDIQYGARWSGVPAVDFIWNALGDGDQLGSVWVRYYDEGGDFDVIGHRTLAMLDTSPWRVCEYHYDEVRLIDGAGAVRRRSVPGSRRRAANRRDVLGQFERDTPTTPASAWAGKYCFAQWRAYGVPRETLDEVAALGPDLQRAELCWRGRPVEVAERVAPGEHGWIRWALDDWDTCADAAYAEYFA